MKKSVQACHFLASKKASSASRRPRHPSPADQCARKACSKPVRRSSASSTGHGLKDPDTATKPQRPLTTGGAGTGRGAKALSLWRRSKQQRAQRARGRIWKFQIRRSGSRSWLAGSLARCSLPVKACGPRENVVRIAVALASARGHRRLGHRSSALAVLALEEANRQQPFSIPGFRLAIRVRSMTAATPRSPSTSPPDVPPTSSNRRSDRISTPGCSNIPASQVYARSHLAMGEQPAASKPPSSPLQQPIPAGDTPKSIFRVQTTDDIQGSSPDASRRRL